VVAFSVVVQGGLVPYVAHRTGVPMRTVEPEPWALSVRFRHEPAGMRRFLVAAGAPADGCTLADLALGEDAWISFISRDGALVPVSRDTVLQPGDEVVVLADPTTRPDPEPLFTSPPHAPTPAPTTG
jgi:cell volume regulation protein A